MDIYKNRINNIKSKITDGAFLVTNDKNIYYFTGLWDSNGYLLITKENAYLFVDFRYGEVAEKTVNSADVIVFNKLFDELNNVLKNDNVTKLYVETNVLTMEQYKTYSDKLNVTLSEENTLDKIILDLRIVKDSYEQQLMQKAQDITEEAFNKIVPLIKVGTTERTLSVELEYQMKLLGAESVSFDLITITGKKTSLPHGVPSNDMIKNGDFVTFDIGATYKGYHSDMTRTVAVGSVTDKMKEVYNIVLDAHKMAMASVKPGMKCSDIDKIARDYIYSKGYEGCFGHATGHGVGLDIHEYPTVSPRCDTILKQGMIVTIEPGIYIKDNFGVRIEDTVIVTENGYKSFVSLPKELTIL